MKEKFDIDEGNIKIEDILNSMTAENVDKAVGAKAVVDEKISAFLSSSTTTLPPPQTTTTQTTTTQPTTDLQNGLPLIDIFLNPDRKKEEKEEIEKKPKYGKRHALTLTLDSHSNTVSTGTIFKDFHKTKR